MRRTRITTIIKRLEKLERKVDNILAIRAMRNRLNWEEKRFLDYFRNCSHPRDWRVRDGEWDCALQILQKAKGVIDKVSTRIDLVMIAMGYRKWKEERNQRRLHLPPGFPKLPGYRTG